MSAVISTSRSAIDLAVVKTRQQTAWSTVAVEFRWAQTQPRRQEPLRSSGCA
jgi:hypothetical protein